MMWEIEFLVRNDRLSADSAEYLESLVSADSGDVAYALAILIESRVAPVSGGLAQEVVPVIEVLITGLAQMVPEVRAQALFLLAQIAGSVDNYKGFSVAAETALCGALPLVAGIAEVGSPDEIAECIDLVSICSYFNFDAAKRGFFYLSKIDSLAEGAIKESAKREMIEIAKFLDLNELSSNSFGDLSRSCRVRGPSSYAFQRVRR